VSMLPNQRVLSNQFYVHTTRYTIRHSKTLFAALRINIFEGRPRTTTFIND